MGIIRKRVFNTGFTIIELLVIIVIIGILSTLVLVSYSGITDMARKAVFASNANSVLRTIQYKTTEDDTFDTLSINETNIASNLRLNADGYDSLAMYKLAGENYVYAVGKNSFSGLVACGTQGKVNVYKADEASCVLGGSGNVVAAVSDVTPGVLGGGNGSTCAVAKTVDSIEDLVYLATSTNSGTSYSGICIKLTVDLDFAQNKSYVSPTNTTFGDLNGNGTTEGLKTELTTAAGFVPIGNGTNKFAGTFAGDQHTIYNLLINRPTTDNVGLIGATNGNNGRRLTGFNLSGVSIVGHNNTGGAIGALNTQDSMTDMTISGNVTGYSGVGIAIGSMGTYTGTSSIATNGNVTGYSNVGGVVGYSYHGGIRAVYTGGSIVYTGSSAGRILGYRDGADPMGYAVSTVTINGATVNSVVKDTSDNNGGTISDLSDITTNINAADSVFDTYIGGDDGDGYYWDYDGSGNLVKKNITTDPITFSLSGSGTTGDPYLINNYNDLKQATQKLDKVFKLMADIDLSGKKFYMFGSYNSRFSGTFFGNNKTISNMTINAPKASYIGFMGATGWGGAGRLSGLNLTNVNLTGSNNVGGAVGLLDAQDLLSDMNISGSVSGNYSVGMAAGTMSTYSTLTSVITNGNVTGNSNIGGVVGYGSNNSMRAINTGGAIICTGSNCGRLLGSRDGGSRMGYAASTITINGATVNNGVNDTNDNNGGSISSLSDITGDINAADSVLDTYIGGDDGGDGWYWDYDGGGNLVKKNTATDPITFSLSGSGTVADPYLVNNYTDLRQATLKLDKVYKLTADINLSGQKFYMFGSWGNTFSGTFYGNNKTISNMTINAPKASFLGFIGMTNGNNGRRLTGLNLTGVNVTGNNNVSGAVGYLNTQDSISDVTVGGSLTGNYNVGMAAGSLNTFSYIASTLTSGSVTGNTNVGGVVGFLSNASVSAINTGGSIVCTGSGSGRIWGGRDGNYTRNAYAVSTITVNGSTVTSSDLTSNNGKDTTAAALSVQSTYTDVGFNFTDETKDYIWYISGPIAVFREGNL